MTYSRQARKIVAAILLVALVGIELLVPLQTARAQFVDPAQATKEFILDPLINLLASQLLRRLGNDIINYIQGGGEPRFIQNPGKFLKNAADAAAGQFIADELGQNICQPFRAELEIILNRVYFTEETFQERVTCTASEIFENFSRFAEDFQDGGWDTWIRLNESRNTPLGVYLRADDQLIRKVSRQEQATQEESRIGQGFFNQKMCSRVLIDFGAGGTETEDITPPLRMDSKEWGRLVEEKMKKTKVGLGVTMGPAGRGQVYKAQDVSCAPGADKIITPGSLIGGQVSQYLGTNIAKLINADEIGEIIGAIIDALINRTVREGLALMPTGRGSYTTPRYGTYSSQAAVRRQRPDAPLLGLEGAAATELLNRVLKVQTDLQFLMRDTDELIGREYAVSQFESFLQGLRNRELGCRTLSSITTVGELVERCLFPSQANEQILTPGPYYLNRSLSQAMTPLWEELLSRFDSIITKAERITTTTPFCGGEIPNLRFTLNPQERDVKNPTSLPITDNKGTIFSYPFPAEAGTSTEYLSVFYKLVGTVDPVLRLRDCPNSPNLGIGMFRTCYAGSFGLIGETQAFLELQGTQRAIAELNLTRQNVEAYTARIAATKERLESLNEELRIVNDLINTITLYASVLTDYDRAGRENNLATALRNYNAALTGGSEETLAAAYLELLAAERATRAGWRQIQLDVLADPGSSEFAKNRAQEKLDIIEKAITLIESSLKPPAQTPTEGASGSIKGGLSGLSPQRITALSEGIKSGNIKLSDAEKELGVDVIDPTQLGLSPSEAVARVLKLEIGTVEDEMRLREANYAEERREVAERLGEFLTDPEERNRVAITGKNGGEWGKYFQLRYDLTYLLIINDAYQSLEREIDKIGSACGL